MFEGLKKFSRPYRKALSAFSDDNCMQFAGAVSFYTLFSLAPVILICIYVAGFFVSDQVIVEQVKNVFTDFFGPRSTEGLLALIDNVKDEDQSIWSVLISSLVLIFSATNLFIQLKDSFNSIFHVKALPGKGLMKVIIDRLISLSVIALLGLALLISLLLDSFVIGFFNYMSKQFEFLSLVFTGLGSNLLTLMLVFSAVWILFSTLPDVKLRKRDITRGSLFSALMLTAGKFLIGWIIGVSTLSELTGASSSVIVLMLWVYYSSAILFLGMELIKAYAEVENISIQAGRYSARMEYVQVQDDGD